jgi:hypothetical protein
VSDGRGKAPGDAPPDEAAAAGAAETMAFTIGSSACMK